MHAEKKRADIQVKTVYEHCRKELKKEVNNEVYLQDKEDRARLDTEKQAKIRMEKNECPNSGNDIITFYNYCNEHSL